MEVWKTLYHDLPTKSFLNFNTSRGRNKGKMNTPKLRTSHKEWFPWKSSILWNRLNDVNILEKTPREAKKIIKVFAKVYYIVYVLH